MKKRLFIILIIICLTLCGCEADVQTDSVLGAYVDKEEVKDDVPMTDITLLYYPDMDTNPITTDCFANHELLKLVYSPLIRIGDGIEPYCVLANTYTPDGDKVTVKLRDGLSFSDGSPVTASDVIKSVNAAKAAEGSPYFGSASKIKRCYAEGDGTVVFVFDKADTDAPALLDIPIMKGGKENIGCGPYIFSKLNGDNVLIPNENYFSKPAVSLIKLVDTKSDANITSLFSVGELDVISVAGYDDLSLTALRDYEIVTSASNNMVYIGVNHTDPTLVSAEFRRALSVCIDRAKIAEQSLVGLASASVYPFNPEWYKMKIYGVNASPDYSEKEVAAALALIGDTSLTLTVPKDSDIKMTVASAIAKEFSALGINLTLKELESEKYTAAVTGGDYQLYLGETAVSRTMDPTYLYKTGGHMNYSGYTNATLDGLFESYKSGDTGLDTYLSEFYKEMPVIPILFRKNVMYSAKGISGYSKLSPWNSFGDITSIRLK